MYIDDAAVILIIILSVTLTVFLIVGIVLLSLLIKLTKKLREIAETASSVAGNVEAASQVLRQSAGPLAVGKFVANIADVFLSRKGRK